MSRYAKLSAAISILSLSACVTNSAYMKTDQELANRYFSCVYLESARGNADVTADKISASHIVCKDEANTYAERLVKNAGVTTQFSWANVLMYMSGDLKKVTMAQMPKITASK